MARSNASDTDETALHHKAPPVEYLQSLLQKSQWGEIELPSGIRPLDQDAVFDRGFEGVVFQFTNRKIPGLIVSETSPKLFELFMDALQLLGEATETMVDVWFMLARSPHDNQFKASDCELVVAESKLYGLEDLLLNNGKVGVGVVSRRRCIELALHKDKVIHIYTPRAKNFRRAVKFLKSRGLKKREDLRFISQQSLVRFIHEESMDQFHAACRDFEAEPCQ